MTEPTAAPPRMPAGQVRFIAMAASAIAFAAVFAWPAFTPIRVLWYYPLEHRWAYQIAADGLAMDWFGRSLLAGAVATAVFTLSSALARRMKPLGTRGHTLWTAWMVTAVVLAMALYAHQLASRRPTPLPLPTWYVPK